MPQLESSNQILNKNFISCSTNDLLEYVSHDFFMLTNSPFNSIDSGENAKYEIVPFPQRAINDKSDIDISAQRFSILSDPSLIKDICCSEIPSWNAHNISPSDLFVEQILAGLSNQIFVVTVKNHDPNLMVTKVLFRIYATFEGDLYDPHNELEIFKILANNNIAPKLIASFPGGRIEEYISGMMMKSENVTNPAIVSAIADILAKIHSLNNCVVELDKFNTGEAYCVTNMRNWSAAAYDLCKSQKVTEEENPTLYKKLKTFDESLEQSFLHSIEDLKLEEAQMETLTIFDAIMDAETNENNGESELLKLKFCHNDVHKGNILVTNSRLRLIDYEYSNFNYPAFDIAYFFVEMTIDYSESTPPYYKHKADPSDFPNEELVALFGSIYLSSVKKKEILPSDSSVKYFVRSILRFALAVHLLIYYWSIVRSTHGKANLEFDYLCYAKSRLTAYYKWKEYLIQRGVIKRY